MSRLRYRLAQLLRSDGRDGEARQLIEDAKKTILESDGMDQDNIEQMLEFLDQHGTYI